MRAKAGDANFFGELKEVKNMKILTSILTIVILCTSTVFAAELPNHPNFTVIEKVKYDPWGDGFLRFQENGKTGIKDLDGNMII
ncbi:MAG: hypothetical protein BWY15_00725 [Firmicutes bacterium ADurb.Bin193]|nr:MAG: hypothetical protein BWY15_00725 [Firmicutes bacterium ADurb.Bin193]